MFKSTRRFIAGAVCPQCRETDKLMMYREGSRSFRECVRCGFKEQMLLGAASQEPGTRVSRNAEQEEDVRPVRILDPGTSGQDR